MADGMGDGTSQETESERVFEPLPPAHGRGFARTWWGVSWQRALEDSALDTAQLRIGRRYARSGAVGAVAVRPGRITAMVRERNGEAHRADVLLRPLDEAAWERLLEVTARTAGHLAALLDGELPPELVEDADAVQVQLLPGIGDLQAHCDCGEWDHCAHTVAVSYQLARLLDEDPMLLLLLLGRGERRLLAELRELSFAQAMGQLADGEGESGEAADAAAPDTVAAVEVYARTVPSALPEPPPLVEAAAEVPDWGRLTEPAAPGLDTAALALLAWDSAQRARESLAEALAPGHAAAVPHPPLDVRRDAVRIAAGRAYDAGARERLVAGGEFEADAFEAAVEAWRFGGLAGLRALEEPAEADGVQLARARDRLGSAWSEGEQMPQLSEEGNRWTVRDAGLQLRYTPDDRWWPYRWDGRRWRPAGPAGHDPAMLLAELGCR